MGKDGLKPFNKTEALEILEILGQLPNLLRLQRCEVDDRPRITVTKVLPAAGKPQSRDFSKLSLGQQQSVLLALMLSSDSNMPLIIDQPEDNLDSEFIFHSLVPFFEPCAVRVLRAMKWSSHPWRLGLHPCAMSRRFLNTSKLKDMASSDDHLGCTRAAAISGSACALVTQLQRELHSLVTRNEELGRRIRSIRWVMRGLQEMASTPAVDYLCATPHPASANRTIAAWSSRHRSSGSPRKSNQASVSLQRACRIALMETETAASLDEIYARIVRRGSFSFLNIEGAIPALVRVLRVMTEDGEVRAFKSGPCWRWERIALVKEISCPSVESQRIGTSRQFSGTNASPLGL